MDNIFQITLCICIGVIIALITQNNGGGRPPRYGG